MEAVLRNVSSAAELLAVAAARSDELRRWDEQTLARAFHWARYCEHVFSRFHANPTVSGLVEEQLRLTNSRLCAVFPGYTDLCFLDLSRCQHVLLVRLLKNPELPVSIMKILFDPASTLNTKLGPGEDITGLCSRIIQCRSALKVLTPLTDSGADAEVQAVMLIERLGSLLSPASQAQRFLDSVLQGREGAEEHFCLVLASALLVGTKAAAPTSSAAFLWDWLRQKPVLLQHMCSTLPSTLLTDLAKEHLKFRDAYCDLLKKWAAEMEYSVSDCEWIQSSNPKVSFQKLTEHFVTLFEACPSLRNNVGKELNDLKVSDGDYDVRGLSVWGDLLSEIDTLLPPSAS